jgi:RNA recognition motif-containing protein
LPLKFGKRPSGYAFVGYASAESAQKAVDQLNEKCKRDPTFDVDSRLMYEAFGERTVRLELARSKDEVAERRKARDERRAAAKATRHLEQNQKTVEEGGVIGEEGASKPKKKSGDRVGVATLNRWSKN